MDLSWELYVSKSPPPPTDLNDGVVPMLVMAHGMGYCRQIWNGVLSELERSEEMGAFRAILVDLRGHGQTGRGTESLSWDLFEQDMTRFLNRLPKDLLKKPMVAVGHSLGATSLMLGEIRQPGRFQTMVVAEPVTISQHGKEDEPTLVSRTLRRKSQWDDIASATKHFCSVLSSWDPRALHGYLYGSLRTCSDASVELACSKEDEASVYSSTAKNHLFEAVSEIQCPIFSMGGAKNTKSHFHEFLRRVGGLSNGSFRLVPEAGHNVPMENPREFALVLRQAILRITTTEAAACQARL